MRRPAPLRPLRRGVGDLAQNRCACGFGSVIRDGGCDFQPSVCLQAVTRIAHPRNHMHAPRRDVRGCD